MMNRLSIRTAYLDEGPAPRTEYDLVVASGSWDPRSTLMLDHITCRATSALLVRYSNAGSSGRSEENTETLLRQLASAAKSTQTVMVDSTDVSSSWIAFRTSLVSAYRSIGRPLRVLVDLSALPRNLSLGLLGFGLASGFVDVADYFYVDAKSYATFNNDALEFTYGKWRPWPIVGLGGASPARTRTHLIVAAGHEGAKTRKLVDSIEPERISIAFVARPDAPSIEAKSRDENARLVETYLVPKSNCITASFSAAAACGQLLELVRMDRLEDSSFPEVPSFLLCGPKPLCLAMAAASVQVGIGDVLYVRPEGHSETYAVDFGRSSVTSISWPWSL